MVIYYMIIFLDSGASMLSGCATTLSWTKAFFEATMHGAKLCIKYAFPLDILYGQYQKVPCSTSFGLLQCGERRGGMG